MHRTLEPTLPLTSQGLLQKPGAKAEEEDTGVSWGFGEDAPPEEDSENSDSDEDAKDLPDYLKSDAAVAKRRDLKVSGSAEYHSMRFNVTRS